MKPFTSSFESSGILLNQSLVNFIFVALIFFFQPKLAWDSSPLEGRDHRLLSSTRDLIAVIYYSYLSDSGFIICDSFTGTNSTRHSVEYINMLGPTGCLLLTVNTNWPLPHIYSLYEVTMSLISPSESYSVNSISGVSPS